VQAIFEGRLKLAINYIRLKFVIVNQDNEIHLTVHKKAILQNGVITLKVNEWG
jgi:hypothetical protein